MATVVVTFFLFVRINICKMDADYIHRPREQLISRRNSRWSMNSHRLEAIVAELMKPISDARRNFDTDLSALLEEYLTEAGLHALDAGDDADEGEPAPNFCELALLLQHSATIYSKKVDFLYQHVLEVSDSLLNSTQELNAAAAAEVTEALPVGQARRKRKASAAGAAGEFVALSVAAAAGARRAADAARPPPTLPRMYAELAPRAAAAADPPLHDYLGEPIGLLADFHLTWRLHEGLLVDDLQGAFRNSESTLRPISLVELQAAIEAAATPPLGSPPAPPRPAPSPPAPSPPAPSPSPPGSPRAPLRASTPLPAPEPPPDTPHTPHTPHTPKSARKERKRRSDLTVDDVIMGNVKLIVSKEFLDQLKEVAREFSIPASWIARVVSKRKRHILSSRRRLRAEDDALSAGFAGWTSSEAAEAVAAAAERSKICALELESDDDGFFEQSSLGEADASGASGASVGAGAVARLAEQAAWQARVLARAGAGGAGADVRELGARVLAALRPPEPAPAPFPRVLAAAARDQPDVSRLLLATLFLANAGNVEIVPGAPLSVNSFSVRVLSTDERLYCAVAADEQFLR